MPNRFDGKVALITGGAQGFGREFGRALAAEGASIAVGDIDLAGAQSQVNALRSEGHPGIAVGFDVAREEEVDSAVKTVISELGGVDILINNAALHLTKYNQPFGALSRNEIRAVFDVNVIGVVNCSLACRDSMRSRGGGVVINISSIAGHISMSPSPYGVSKLAVRGLTIALAKEFAIDGVRVNAIAPGLIGSENALSDLPPETFETYVNELQLVHRLGTMTDIVNALIFLCSEESSFVTGETLQVSGGFPLFI
jgi:3-oxoacyl-[acyl-carrier protein] reductase